MRGGGTTSVEISVVYTTIHMTTPSEFFPLEVRNKIHRIEIPRVNMLDAH